MMAANERRERAADILADGLGAFVAMAMFRFCPKYRADQA